MRRHAIILGLTFVGLAVFAVLAGWSFFEGSQLSGGWRSLGAVLPFLLGGCVVAAALAAFLMWLAIYSANHRYDDRADSEGH